MLCKSRQDWKKPQPERRNGFVGAHKQVQYIGKLLRKYIKAALGICGVIVRKGSLAK